MGAVVLKHTDGSLHHRVWSSDLLSAVLTAENIFFQPFPSKLFVSGEQTEQRRRRSQPGQRGFEE